MNSLVNGNIRINQLQGTLKIQLIGTIEFILIS